TRRCCAGSGGPATRRRPSTPGSTWGGCAPSWNGPGTSRCSSPSRGLVTASPPPPSHDRDRAAPGGRGQPAGAGAVMPMTGRRWLAGAALAGLAAATLSACGPSATAPPAAGGSADLPAVTARSFSMDFSQMRKLRAVTRLGSGKIGVLLPDTTTSPRYTEFDAPYLARALEAAGLSRSQFMITNAQGSD